MLREMHVDRFNFVLDEFIMRRNRRTRAELYAKGHLPGYWNDTV